MELIDALGRGATILGGMLAVVTIQGWAQGYIMSPTKPEKVAGREIIAIMTILAPFLLAGVLMTRKEEMPEDVGYMLAFMLGYLMCFAGFVVDFYRRNGGGR